MTRHEQATLTAGAAIIIAVAVLGGYALYGGVMGIVDAIAWLLG